MKKNTIKNMTKTTTVNSVKSAPVQLTKIKAIKNMKKTKNHETEIKASLDAILGSLDKIQMPFTQMLAFNMCLSSDYPEPYRSAADELVLVLSCDKTAVEDLHYHISKGMRDQDLGSFNEALDKLGVFEGRIPNPMVPKYSYAPFDVRPLINLLKRMPGRDPGTGLSMDCQNAYEFETELARIREGVKL